VPFIAGLPVPPGSEDAHYQPDTVGPNRPLYEHCALAIDSSLEVGAHGLPLIGGGDWNDGMNAVGHDHRGESVWLAWFQIAVLRRFAPVAVSRGDLARSASWRAHAAALEASVEENAWDGLWYRRAFFDDGTPLGSSDSPQCRIDSIAQSWAVLSGAADPQRARTAIDSMLRHLEKRGERLMLLLAPPFDRPLRDPGYIAAYPPGIRENGGQYSHAATWALAALAELRQPADAARLMATLNPILRAATRDDALLYKLEPYVMAADVYSEAPHAGRGGWSWYTGAAGWYFRAVLEWVLGVRVHAATIAFEPCMPLEWQHYEVDYRTERYDYRIRIERRGSAGTISVQLDGVRQPTAAVPLVPDGRTHRVLVALE
jgi:cyclic beta-1,2-glucan synthetase